MVKQTPWSERRFNFDFPVGLLPCILTRLRGTPARVEEIARRLPDSILTRRIGNAWSIQEHIGHLLDLEELHEKRIEDYESGAASLRPADLKNQKTEEARYNSKSFESILTSFRSARLHFVRRFEEMDEAFLSRSALHPRLQQQMRVVDLAFFVAEHDDHHVARMVSLSSTLLNQSLEPAPV